MKIAIMQPYLFPYIGYFQLINVVDKFVLYDDVNYIKKGWINRNNILIYEKPHTFVIPIAKVSQNKKINEHYIQNDGTSISKILKTMSEGYKKAPHFSNVFEMISNLFQNGDMNIATFIYESIQSICQELNITTEIIKSSSIYKNTALTGQDRIIDICKKENVQSYFNPIGGVNLYDKKLFAMNNLNLNFIKTNNIQYDQKMKSNEFVPNLSIIDILMYNGFEKTKHLLNQYEII